MENIMGDFKCDGSVLNNVSRELESIQELINDSYNIANNVYSQIESGISWEGESQKAMIAFMDLCLQYHKMFIGISIGISNDFIDNRIYCAPILKAINTFKELEKNIENFYSESTAYKNIMEEI